MYIGVGALRRWDEAEDFFEICIGSPAQLYVRLEALKKLKLVQLIAREKVRFPSFIVGRFGLIKGSG
jgi:COP9 signalosome complex subunit 3